MNTRKSNKRKFFNPNPGMDFNNSKQGGIKDVNDR